MGIHVAASDAVGSESHSQRLIAASLPVLLLVERASGSAPAERRYEARCHGCGYGAAVAHPLLHCPMCGGDWRVVRVTATVGEGDAGL
jgi:rRNA maturation endonuclease Nob1